MNRYFIVSLLALSIGVLCRSETDVEDGPMKLETALQAFADYEYSQPKKILHDTRLAAYRGANDEKIRLENESLLLEFIQSEASLDARREACMWLANLATEKGLSTLKRLANDGGIGDVVEIVLSHTLARPFDTESSHALKNFVSSVKESQQKSDILIRAIQGDDERLARLAFELVANGTATYELSAWLENNILQLPSPRQLIALNTLQIVAAPEAATIIERLARQGKRLARLEALRLLGTLGRQKDFDYLANLLSSSDSEVANAATAAMIVMPEDVIRDYLIQNLQSNDAAVQIKMIDIVVERGAAYATDYLWVIAEEANNPNQESAIKALGTAAPPKAFGRVLEKFLKMRDIPQKKDWQGVVWDLARRQPDYDEALLEIGEAKAVATEPDSLLLTTLAEKLRSLKPTQSLDEVRDP